MHDIFAHPGLSIVFLAWIVCGTHSIVHKDKKFEILWIAVYLTLGWAAYHIFILYKTAAALNH